MGLIQTIIGKGVGSLIDSVGTVIDGLNLSGEEKQKHEFAMTQLKLAALQTQQQLEAEIEKAMVADAANLREQGKLEIQSDDAFVGVVLDCDDPRLSLVVVKFVRDDEVDIGQVVAREQRLDRGDLHAGFRTELETGTHACGVEVLLETAERLRHELASMHDEKHRPARAADELLG